MSTGPRTAPAVGKKSAATGVITSWRRAIRLAVERGHPSLLAVHLTRGRVPAELQDEVYSLVIDAPWREMEPKCGRPAKLNAVDKITICNLYTLLVGGFLLLDGQRRSRQVIVDHLANTYGVSPSTVVRVLKESGRSLPKPSRRF